MIRGLVALVSFAVMLTMPVFTWAEQQATVDVGRVITVSSVQERLDVVFDVPTGVSAWKRPLRVAPWIAWTHLDSGLAEPLDSNAFTEVGCTVAALTRTKGTSLGINSIAGEMAPQ